MVTREDVIWIAVLAIFGLVMSRFWGFDTATSVAVVVILSLGRLAYAWYARRSFRR